jgi:23S rRNA U2552 (ribose-2'-O)-methylase RlmE/FtsJ
MEHCLNSQSCITSNFKISFLHQNMHYEIGISKKLILSIFKISQLKLIISDLYTGHLRLSQPQPLHVVKTGTTSSHSNTATHRMITHCSQTHLQETWIKHKCTFTKKLYNPKNIKMKGNLILPLINGIQGISYRK